MDKQLEFNLFTIPLISKIEQIVCIENYFITNILVESISFKLEYDFMFPRVFKIYWSGMSHKSNFNDSLWHKLSMSKDIQIILKIDDEYVLGTFRVLHKLETLVNDMITFNIVFVASNFKAKKLFQCDLCKGLSYKEGTCLTCTGYWTEVVENPFYCIEDADYIPHYTQTNLFWG